MIIDDIRNNLNDIITILKYKNSRQLYIYCEKNIFKYMEDYINSINQNLQGIIIHIINKNINLNEDLIIFIQSISNISINNKNKNIYLLNTEQLSRKKILNKIIEYSKIVTIIDYSKENVKILELNNVKNTIYFPYIYNKKEIYNISKTKLICGICLDNTVTRKQIINEKSFKQFNINNIKGWNEIRDKELFQHKILINLSADIDYNMFETIRCYRCLFNKMIIISDNKYNNNLIDYKEHILFSKVEDMPQLISKIINNYNYYYKKLNLDNINIKLNDHLINKKYLI